MATAVPTAVEAAATRVDRQQGTGLILRRGLRLLVLWLLLLLLLLLSFWGGFVGIFELFEAGGCGCGGGQGVDGW